jgi:hypothetical protein
MKNVLMTWTHGDAVYRTPNIDVVSACRRTYEAFEEKVIDCEQLVIVAREAKPANMVRHIGVIIGV